MAFAMEAGGVSNKSKEKHLTLIQGYGRAPVQEVFGNRPPVVGFQRPQEAIETERRRNQKPITPTEITPTEPHYHGTLEEHTSLVEVGPARWSGTLPLTVAEATLTAAGIIDSED